MGVHPRTEPELGVFSAFVSAHEPMLLQALVATYGAVDGREATADALSWAWEHWDRLLDVENKRGYLYRVGQSATRRFSARALPSTLTVPDAHHLPDIDPGLLPALNRLSEQQRTIVVLVHAFGWTQTEVSRLLEVTPSTVREHLRRAMERLRQALEVCHVD